MSVMLLDETKAGSLTEGICQFNQMWNSGRFIDHSNEGKLCYNAVQKFVRELYQANLNTWNKKYNQNDTILDILPATGERMNKYQTLKSLQCLHYNIETEYVPEAKKIFDEVKVMVDEIAYILVTDQEQYKEAEWG